MQFIGQSSCPSFFNAQAIGGDWAHAGLQPVVELLKEAARKGLFKPDPLIPFEVCPREDVFELVKAQWCAKYKSV